MGKADLGFTTYVILTIILLVGCISTDIKGIQLDGRVPLLKGESLKKYQVIIVKQLKHGRWRRSLDTIGSSKKGHEEQVTFSVDGGGRRFVLELFLNRVLLPEGSQTSHFTLDDTPLTLTSQAVDNCYYQGTIQGAQHSYVALSTCRGVEGLIFDGQEKHYIQPFGEPKNTTLISSSYIMFQMKDLVLPKTMCGSHKTTADSTTKKKIKQKNLRTRRSLESETKYIELVIVNDYSHYKHYLDMNSNNPEKALTQTILRARNIANIVDSLYRPLNVRVALVKLVVWNSKDAIDVVEDSSTALDNFVKWRNDVLIKKMKVRHDNAQLLTHIDFKGPTVGKAHVLAICTSRSAGVVQDHSSNAAATAATFAHEMGHNLGLSHDKKDCKCSANMHNHSCIMSGVARSVPATDWSACSIKEFQIMLDRGLDSCLFNQPKKLYGNAICGNGFKETGEECDCGSLKECKMYSDSCCNPATCKLLPGSECSEGPCCSGCKLKKGVLCRSKVTECDLPEYCDGENESCPPNRFVYNGRKCQDGKAYCYQGVCPSHDEQCQTLWGGEVKSGPRNCYTINMKGSYHGSCHQFSNGSFLPCKYKDIYCGMLHCTNTKTDLPIIGTERNAYKYTWKVRGGSVICRSTSLELGYDVPDPGMAKEGTKCGNDKVCYNHKCVNVTKLLSVIPKCQGDCYRNGICDNLGDCFCDDCWKGKECSEPTACHFYHPLPTPYHPLPTPYHPLPTPYRHLTDTILPTPFYDTGRSSVAGIVILVFVFIILVVVCVAAVIYRDKLKAKYQERKQSRERRYESVDHKTTNVSSTEKPKPKNLHSLPAVTTAPKPPLSRTTPNRQPGNIELPSWPPEPKTDSPVQRRPPPGPPSGPPNSFARPGIYAEINDPKPQAKYPASNVSEDTKQPNKLAQLKRTDHSSASKPQLPGQRALLPPISHGKETTPKSLPVKPSDVKLSTPSTKVAQPSLNKPARMPPAPPQRPRGAPIKPPMPPPAPR